MTFQRQIIRHEACPRCNAVADIRADDTEEEPPVPGVVLLVLVCPKCQLRRAAGMTTKDVLALEEKETKLLKTLQAGGFNQANLRRIRAKLRDVQNRLDRARLGV